MGMLRQPVLAIPALPRERRQQPVLDRCGNDVKAMCRLRLLADDEQELALLSLFRHAEMLDPVDGGFIQVHEVPQYIYVPLLPANHLGCCCGQNGSSKLIRLVRSSREVFNCLRETPDAGVPFASCSEELDNYRSKAGGL